MQIRLPQRPSTAVAALVALAALVTAPAALAQRYDDRTHTLRIRGGIFEPDGESRYWEESALDFTGGPEDFEDAILGADYRLGLSGRLGLLVSVNGYSGSSDRTYLDFVDNFGDEIAHEATLDIASVTAGLTLHLAPRHFAVQPYVGAGGGLYAWELQESGDFIDFGFDPPDVFSDTFISEGTATGYFFLAGVDVPLTPNVALFAEGRWHRVEDELADDFEGFGDIDLSGRAITGGVALTF